MKKRNCSTPFDIYKITSRRRKTRDKRRLVVEPPKQQSSRLTTSWQEHTKKSSLCVLTRQIGFVRIADEFNEMKPTWRFSLTFNDVWRQSLQKQTRIGRVRSRLHNQKKRGAFIDWNGTRPAVDISICQRHSTRLQGYKELKSIREKDRGQQREQQKRTTTLSEQQISPGEIYYFCLKVVPQRVGGGARGRLFSRTSLLRLFRQRCHNCDKTPPISTCPISQAQHFRLMALGCRRSLCLARSSWISIKDWKWESWKVNLIIGSCGKCRASKVCIVWTLNCTHLSQLHRQRLLLEAISRTHWIKRWQDT